MSDRPLVVLKFGSSVLRSESDLPVVAEEIKRHVDAGHSVVAVVSAIGESTESLIARARSVGHDARDAPIGKARGKDAPAERPVAILPGFVGRDENGNFSLLGRGGSDLTALFVAHCLKAARCRLLKAVVFAHRHRLPFEVGACGGDRSSLIGKPTSGDLIGKPAWGERRLVS